MWRKSRQGETLCNGAVASKYADVIYLTTDNPRDEDPIVINESIIAGFTEQQYYEIYLDRKLAIHQALAKAEKGDIVLVAGKGMNKHSKLKIKSSLFRSTMY